MSEFDVAIPVVSTVSSDDSSSDEWSSNDSEEGAGSRMDGGARIDSSRLSSSFTLSSTGAVMTGPPRGTLRLDKTEARAGESVGVYWDIPTVQTCPGDWIGVYEKGRLTLTCIASI